jgi:hypothetical protein
MKGKLTKTEKGWMINYNYSVNKNDWETLPLHPDFIEMMDTCFTSKFSHEIEFEIVTEWWNGEVGVNGLAYAKLINQSFIDNRKDKLEILARLLAKTWFYCDWKWESPNERVMQMLMQDLGLYPFKDEDEAIQQTQVDDELYREASRRVPTYGKLSEDLVENKLDLSKIKQKLDETLANETSESLTEWMNGKREDDVEKLAIDKIIEMLESQIVLSAYNKLGGTQRTGDYRIGLRKAIDICSEVKDELPKQETLYTMEQVREAIELAMDFSQLAQQEISDEEIEEEIRNRYMTPIADYAWRDACKWYREQLKSKQ